MWWQKEHLTEKCVRNKLNALSVSTHKQVPGRKSWHPPAAVISQREMFSNANFSPNHEYVGWVTWAPFIALQLCKSSCCVLGSQFIKWGCELSASLTYYNNSSSKANNAWEQCKVILRNRRWELYSSEIPLRESGLTKCSCQIWLESGW